MQRLSTNKAPTCYAIHPSTIFVAYLNNHRKENRSNANAVDSTYCVSRGNLAFE